MPGRSIFAVRILCWTMLALVSFSAFSAPFGITSINNRGNITWPNAFNSGVVSVLSASSIHLWFNGNDSNHYRVGDGQWFFNNPTVPKVSRVRSAILALGLIYDTPVDLFSSQMDSIRCVLLDMTMPVWDGEKTLHELKQIKPDIKIVLNSGYTEHNTAKLFVNQGLAHFIKKPYSLEELKQTLKQVLNEDNRPTKNPRIS